MPLNLPVSRSVVLANSDPVPSALLNELQDAIIGNKHPLLRFAIPASAFVLEGGSGATLSDAVWTPTAVVAMQAPIPCRVGQRIKNIRAEYNRGGATQISFYLKKAVGATVTTLATATITTGSGIVEAQLFGTDPSYVVEAGAQVYLRVVMDNAAHRLYQASALIDCL